ncbi:ABC transporter substrate-binding protein [Bordetella sp. FB-8]|uniref:ABC transporter substrate-binding protein n=1 Tax=Bordetella sp. FB-8 TaxID=1159870 RepID=UPI0003717FAD|nr:ABC transporter substrate-binding protein [Bordetella sp. FB-8]
MKRILAQAALALGLAAATSAAMSAASTAAPLEIGYLPILPAAQLFVAAGQNALPAVDGAPPKLVQFQSGPAMVQAILAGQLDAAYVGIGPALVVAAKGGDFKVVASNVVEQVSLVARGDLAPYFAPGSDASTAFARFAKDKGRLPVIASYPRGSVPEAALQYWLRKRIKADPASYTLITQGEAQIQQSLLTGAVDAAAILEPTITSVLDKEPKARVVAHGSDLFPHQPGAVLLVRGKLIREHPDLVKALVAEQISATALLRDDPAKAAPLVQKYVAGGRLPVKLVEQAIRNSRDQFQADPNVIIPATQALQQFLKDTDAQQGPLVDLSRLFDTRFYDAAAKASAQQ